MIQKIQKWFRRWLNNKLPPIIIFLTFQMITNFYFILFLIIFCLKWILISIFFIGMSHWWVLGRFRLFCWKLHNVEQIWYFMEHHFWMIHCTNVYWEGKLFSQLNFFNLFFPSCNKDYQYVDYEFVDYLFSILVKNVPTMILFILVIGFMILPEISIELYISITAIRSICAPKNE